MSDLTDDEIRRLGGQGCHLNYDESMALAQAALDARAMAAIHADNVGKANAAWDRLFAERNELEDALVACRRERDAALAAKEAAERERDTLRGLYDGAVVLANQEEQRAEAAERAEERLRQREHDLLEQAGDAESMLLTRDRTIERLAAAGEALEPFVAHQRGCVLRQYPCLCGRDAALAAWRAARGDQP